VTGRHLATVWRGAASILALGILLAGVPTMLLITAGAPLPHGLPNWSQFTAALTQTGIPDSAILEGLAVVCWLLWLDLALAVVTEAVAASQGRPLPLPAFARPLQPLAAYLIASVVLAVSVVSSRSAATSVSGLRTALAATAGQQVRSVPPNGNPQTVETEGLSPARSVATAEATSTPAAGPVGGDYTVRSGDTLWDIAARKLGDPLRWPQIFRLNRGRVEPDSRRFTSPHWIWPRWILELPPTPASTAQPPSASNGSNGSAPATSPAPSTRPSATPATGQPPATDARPSPTLGLPPAPATCHSLVPTSPGRPAGPISPAPTGPGSQGPGAAAPSSRPQPAQPVTLPTGDVVGAALAAGIVAAIAAARLRSRHAAAGRVRPHPGYLSLLTPLVRRLAAARWRPTERVASDPDANLQPRAEGPEQPGVVVIGEAGGQELAVDVGKLSGTGFTGEGARGVLRHLIVAFLQHAASDRAEVWLFEQTATLAPSAEGVPAVKVVPDVESAIGRLEVELVQRTRTLEEHEVSDFAALLRKNPAEPLPALLVVAPELADDAARERLKALVALGRQLGVGIVFSGRSPLDVQLAAAAGGTLQAATGAPIPADKPVRLYTLSPTAATELLAVIAASRGAPLPAAMAAESVLRAPPPTHDPRAPQAPVHIALFTNLPLVRVRGEQLEAVLERVTPIDATPTGRERLRDRGRELLAFLALHSEGAPREQVLAELLPDDDPKTALDKLRRDIFNVRDVLRRATQQPHAKFVQFVGERYRLDCDLVDCDVWQVEGALRELREQVDGSDQIAKLRLVLSAYRGQLLGNAPYEWVNPGLRESYVRRVVDAGQRLSRLLEQSGDIEGAIDAAEHALAADRDDEELYRRLMRLQMAVGRHDAAKRVFRELEAHLAEIDAEPAEETTRLLRQ
jgi:DNA-binding SARP family transcriptional activator